MVKEHISWYSERLQRDMSIRIYGDKGTPVLVFPTQDAMSDNFENFGMIDTLSGYLNEGRIQLFCVDTVDTETWSNVWGDKGWRASRQEAYYNYIVAEVLPFIADRNGTGKLPIVTGCSLGGLHAAILFLRRPELFAGILSLSGVYDAKFFFEEDKKHHLVDYTEKLKKIVFQDGLGTLYDKAQRLEKITVFLNHKLDLGLDDAKLQRASLLAKADLATQMVMEFTELQGVMGKEYALIDGEDKGVAEAINEQYQPRFAGDVLPQTDMGKVLGIADKFDTITGMFSRGFIPTGSQDPFALRRQTIGILNILMDAGWNLNCHEVFAFVLSLLGVEGEDAAKVMGQLDDYFTLRLKNIFQDKGMDYHIIDCVLASDTLNAYEEARRAQALIDADIMGKTDLLQAFTRVSNMIKGADNTGVNPDLFETEEEKALYSACQAMQVNLPQKYAVYDYEGVAEVLSEGIAAINDFLDNVLVMHKDEAVKENRLHLLALTYSLIQPLGDIKKLA